MQHALQTKGILFQLKESLQCFRIVDIVLEEACPNLAYHVLYSSAKLLELQAL